MYIYIINIQLKTFSLVLNGHIWIHSEGEFTLDLV